MWLIVKRRVATARQHTVADVCDALEVIAPTTLAQSWDNVGLLAGDMSAPVGVLLLCIDLTPAVVDEAIRRRADFVLAYHPPILKPIAALRVPGKGTDAIVFRCIRDGIAVYSTHTALDAADGGTNDTLADVCGMGETEPLEYVDRAGPGEVKLVVFVPPSEVEHVADAMFQAGAGHIGDYSRCSFRIDGTGSFLGGATTSPSVGAQGQMEYVDEVRLESVVSAMHLPAVVRAMIRAHSYEEPAFDIVPLQPRPVRGIGRCGALPGVTTPARLADKLKHATRATHVQIVGGRDHEIDRAIIVAGAAGSLPLRTALGSRDVIITGEIRHHEALAVDRHGCAAIALGHWASEQPVLESVRRRLEAALPGTSATVSEADRCPFQTA